MLCPLGTKIWYREARKIRVNKEHDYSPSTTPAYWSAINASASAQGCKDNLEVGWGDFASEKDMGGGVENEGGWRVIWARSTSSGTKGKLEKRWNGHWACDDRDSGNGAFQPRGGRGLGSGSAGAGLSMLANSIACSLFVEHEERGSECLREHIRPCERRNLQQSPADGRRGLQFRVDEVGILSRMSEFAPVLDLCENCSNRDSANGARHAHNCPHHQCIGNFKRDKYLTIPRNEVARLNCWEELLSRENGRLKPADGSEKEL
ncbi:hypothetical protein B0H14DRAFT_2641078 [Mycena olivaceomarginata]|nr:hypothetical protein B0H14DRAFT_2641078 [Mycena olivaceomarginata]